MDNRSSMHLHETARNSTTTMSLLEKLRRWPEEDDNGRESRESRARLSLLERLQQREEIARRKLELLYQHKSEFPASIRPRIDEVWSATNQNVPSPEIYPSSQKLNLVDKAVHQYFLGAKRVDEHRVSHKDLSNSLNSAVDTEEEVETAIRFFPTLIRQTTQSMDILIYRHPLYMMASEPQALAFIPLYVRVVMDIIGTGPMKEVLLLHSIKYHFLEAIRRILRNPEHDLETKDSASLLAIQSLLGTVYFDENRFVIEYQLSQMVSFIYPLLRRDPIRRDPTHEKISFVERRIRFLIEWRPSLLRVWNKKSNQMTFLQMYTYHTLATWKRMDKDAGRKIFEVIVELGLTYFPGDLGFVFYSDTFRKCCNVFGHKEVSKIVHEKLVRFIGNSSNNAGYLSQMVFEAAASGEISLDGVYTLVRMNPAAALASIDGLQDRKRQLDIGFFEAHSLAKAEGVEDRLQHLDIGFFQAHQQRNR